ncbi:ATP-binding protein [Wenjunlia vitaminophila]|nr:ATP-binding protein [Wenjunlia vitaminophila]
MDERRHVLLVGRYPRRAEAVARARRGAALAYAAYPWIDGDVVELLVSEVATNAVRHADGSGFYLLCHSPSPLDGSVQVEVHDRGPALPCRPPVAELAEGGRGLVLLDRLAPGWRTERTVSGKSLVFTLDGGGRTA